ncbi:DUF4432 family protein [Microbacterium sp. 4R-513]|uniref:DUF4432 family protein n=1 Tax=Microbacterium sp. 4R-513 TaxID=2567934 RepID=UPI0013E127C3|nr:DUF4432 family protein [Microbacterium sp. 4R-513]QIG39427.1 DUF4432 family protein [Microbacterium sp. 4R-513]
MTITLAGRRFEVVVAPERGADIVQVTDLQTGTPLLAVSPTGLVATPPSGAGSMAEWLAGYPGGWQLLVPNAGPERTHGGVTQGFHGEAALARWNVIAQSAASCDLETWLATAPLHLHRTVTADAEGLTVTDRIRNLSPQTVHARVMQHPAFGAPFLDADAFLEVPAATVIADGEAPGSLAAHGHVGTPAEVLGAHVGDRGISLPGPGARESVFAAFTDFARPEATFHSPNRGFGVRLSWDAATYPHAWFWIEANAGSGWPWFRRLYAVAVEPSNVLPGEGQTSRGDSRGGPGVALDPDHPLITTTRLSRVTASS